MLFVPNKGRIHSALLALQNGTTQCACVAYCVSFVITFKMYVKIKSRFATHPLTTTLFLGRYDNHPFKISGFRELTPGIMGGRADRHTDVQGQYNVQPLMYLLDYKYGFTSHTTYIYCKRKKFTNGPTCIAHGRVHPVFLYSVRSWRVWEALDNYWCAQSTGLCSSLQFVCGMQLKPLH